MEYDLATTRFITFDGEVVGEWLCSQVIGLSIPQLDAETPVVMAQKSHDYQLAIKKQRPNAWSKWTPEEEQQLRAEYEKGLTLDEMADMHLRTPVAISERLVRIGIYSQDYPKLGTRTQNRHYQSIEPWKGKQPTKGHQSLCVLVVAMKFSHGLACAGLIATRQTWLLGESAETFTQCTEA